VKEGIDLDTDLDKWLYVLKSMSRMEKLPVYLRKPIFEKLFNIAAYINLTKEEKTMYDSSLKYKWDNKNVMDYAVSTTEARGEAKGMEKGEYKKALDIAREMKKDGLPLAQISKFTKLSAEEIEKL
jgi:predicted transposase/invertase (TIGR01784 family)